MKSQIKEIYIKMRMLTTMAVVLLVSFLCSSVSVAETTPKIEAKNDIISSVPAMSIDSVVEAQNMALETVSLKNATNTLLETQYIDNSQNLQIDASSNLVIVNEALYFDQLTIIGENIVLVIGENGSITIGDGLYINTNTGNTNIVNGGTMITTGSSVTINGGIGSIELIENITIPITTPLSGGTISVNNAPDVTTGSLIPGSAVHNDVGATFVMTVTTTTVTENDGIDKLKQRAEEELRWDFIRKRHAENRSRMLKSFESPAEDTEK